MNDALIEVHGLQKAYRLPSVRRETVRDHFLHLFRPRTYERLEVLRSVDFEVRRGEAVGLMGGNGAGKSTLLKIVSGIIQPDAGTVTVRAPLTPILELGVGWNPELDAVDNILLIGTGLGLSLRDARRAVDEILDFAGVDRFAALELKHWSSGMAARLAYSVAFKAVREVLIIDEVFAVGDAGFKLRCERRFQELRAQGHTLLMVSHDPKVISTFCDRALLLEDGRISAAGSGESVASRYAERSIAKVAAG